MEQQPEKKMSLKNSTKQRQRADNPSAHIAKNPYKQDKPSTSAITGSGTTKQKDMKEMKQAQVLMSHSAQCAGQNTWTLSTDEVSTMEQNPTTQKHETNECRCARCESRDKDMKEFYMVRMED